MHTDLSPHLHTDECNNIINLLRQCRIDHPATKWIGKCNPEYDEMTKCLKRERLARRKKNFEASLERKERLNVIFKEQAKMRDSNI